MFALIKLFIFLFLLVLAFTVPLGKRTFAGHMKAIWSSTETKEFRKGVDETVDKIKNKDKTKAPKKEPHTKKQTNKKKIKKSNGNIKPSKTVNRKRRRAGKKRVAR